MKTNQTKLEPLKKKVAIKSTEKLCWNCLQEKDEIHKIELGPLGYGSEFDCCSTQIQLCDDCYNASNPEIWSDELVYDNDDCKEYDWSHYKYEDKMFDYFNNLPIEGKQFVMNEYWIGDYFMDPQDWIDYELGILSHEKAKEYGLYSKQEISAYIERFPKCKWPANRIYSDGNKACWCPFGASGDYDQEIGDSISVECYKCPYYNERSPEDTISNILNKDFNEYVILAKAAVIKAAHKEMDVLLFSDFDMEKIPNELLETAESSTDLLKLRGKDVINKIRDIAYPIDKLPADKADRMILELCKNHTIVYDKKNDIYLYTSNGDSKIRNIKIVKVDTSKEWAIVKNNNEEKLAYIKQIHPLIGFCMIN